MSLDELKAVLIADYHSYTKLVKYYENVRRNTDSGFYKNQYQSQIHKYNAKREVLRYVLKLIEKVESDTSGISQF